MMEGLFRFVALVVGVCVCVVHPSLVSLAVFLLVFAAVLLVQAGSDDPAKRGRERDQ